MADSTSYASDPLVAGLRAIVSSERVLARPIDLAAYASDASLYHLVPRAVVRPQTTGEVADLFRFSREQSVPLVFRAAGTSLSGQAITDGILTDVATNWRRVEVLDGGRRVRVEPGVIGGTVNRLLAPHRARLGPDPASVHACMMGGILANNSSGMCCGVAQNAYRTLESMVFVLPSGTLVDTSEPDAGTKLQQREPALSAGLLALKQEIGARPALRDRIRAKFRMKNTMGYSLNAFVDFERPADILQHLLIGSEGTLGFIASAVLRTVPDLPARYTGLLLFPGIRDACAAIEPLRDGGAAALEVMDRSSLRSVEHQRGMPVAIAGLPAEAAALLIECQCADDLERRALAPRIDDLVGRFTLAHPPLLTEQPDEQAALWRIRQGLFPSVGAGRARGTTVVIEDVAFPVERLADAVVDLRDLLGSHGYADAIIFGHAKDGNLHFVLSQSFNSAQAIDQYARFMDELVALVARRYDGALKAEHGTGRNMAPFVEAEWGHEAWSIMRRVKDLIDPWGLLNPGVVISADPRAHLKDLKSLPAVDAEVDTCIECGYCETKCPSRNLTLTPRQRIVVRRAIARLGAGPGSGSMAAELEADFGYDGLDTCAVDGLCATACPVAIDTGQLTKRLRGARHCPAAHAIAAQMAHHFGAVERCVRLGLAAGSLAERLLGTAAVGALTEGARTVLGRAVPRWLPPMPRPARGALPGTDPTGAAAVYFPSCLSRTIGHLPGEPDGQPLASVLVNVAARASAPVWIPPDAAGHCCGVPFASKGYNRAHRLMAERTVSRLWEWTDHGRLPVVVDTSPCAYGLKTCRPSLGAATARIYDGLTIFDSIEFVAATLLPRLRIRRRAGTVTLHPVCSVVKMELSGVLEQIAAACSEHVHVPASAGCCGFAGDLGWLVPELTASATADEALEVRARPSDGCYSSSRTCEIGMTRATGQPYRSYLYLLDWATRP